MKLFVLNLLIFILLIICVPFLIFYERRALGIFQIRIGLFIYFLNSLIIFFADFLKILGKYNHYIFSFNYFFLCFSCLIFTLITILIYFFFPFLFYNLKLFFVYFLFFLVLMSLIPFPFSLFIFLSNSIFSFFGNIRSIFLLISYELVFNFIIIIFLSMLIYKFVVLSLYFYLINFFLFIIFFFCLLADASRVPFDLIEGESEIVSGFNTEFALVVFLLVFFGEYIIFFFFILLFCYFINFNLFFGLVFFLFSRALLVRVFFFI